MLNAGFPAVRITVAIENYNWQHQDLRVENGIQYGDTIDRMDFPYLTKVVKLNVAALAALASAPQPPEPEIQGAVSTDTTLSWNEVKGASAYIVRWRRTDAANWQHGLRLTDAGCAIIPVGVKGGAAPVRPNRCGHTLKGVRVDDFVFGVSSVSKDGFESPVASAVPGGAFRPHSPPPPPQP
jgi:hypothetical protein